MRSWFGLRRPLRDTVERVARGDRLYPPPHPPRAPGVPGTRRTPRGWLVALALALSPSCVNLYTIDEDIQLGTQAYEEILAGQPILSAGPEVEMVHRVTERLVASAIELDPQLDQTPDSIASRFPWEVRVIDDPNTVNAFALPGGKIAVYTGILPVAEDDAGLAVVLGHEIAHATARHGTERLSRNMGFEAVIQVLTRGDPNSAELAGIIANLGVGLPFSRKDELEADEIGLLYMANAGYDPRRAVEFWQRMSELSGGSPPELLSTHPSDEHRIERIRELLPRALPLYEARAAAAPGGPDTLAQEGFSIPNGL